MSGPLFSVGIADKSEHEDIRLLVDRIYSQAGYVDNTTTDRSPITEFLGEIDTYIIVARLGITIVGTVSIIEDGVSGLPMDVLYHSEIKSLRSKQVSIAEVCQLVVDNDFLADRKRQEVMTATDVSLGLFTELIRQGFALDIKYFLFTINPKHRSFYESLGCTQIGEEKLYPSVNNAPALAYQLDLPALLTVSMTNQANFLVQRIFKDLAVR